MHRNLFCPICGEIVLVETDAKLPEVHRLPEHRPLGNVNMCAGLVVTVTLDFDRCAKCNCAIGKHPSGLCIRCFRKNPEAVAAAEGRIIAEWAGLPPDPPAP